MKRQRLRKPAAIIVYIIAANRREARLIGETLVKERLAACANVIGNIHSVYRWRGKIEKAHEALLLVKTTARLSKQIIKRISELHSYKCPCIVTLPLTGGNKKYLDWIEESVK